MVLFLSWASLCLWLNFGEQRRILDFAPQEIDCLPSLCQCTQFTLLVITKSQFINIQAQFDLFGKQDMGFRGGVELGVFRLLFLEGKKKPEIPNKEEMQELSFESYKHKPNKNALPWHYSLMNLHSLIFASRADLLQIMDLQSFNISSGLFILVLWLLQKAPSMLWYFGFSFNDC